MAPPKLVVLFLARHRAGEGLNPGDTADRRGLPPRVAVVRDGVLEPIALPSEREGASRLLGALALPAWLHDSAYAPDGHHLGSRRRTEDVLKSMRMSSPTESRARVRDLGPAFEGAGLKASDYLDIELKSRRTPFRELRNACDDVSLLLDAQDFEDVRWILDTSALSGTGAPDVAMGWLWDPAAKRDVLARYRELEDHTRRHEEGPRCGWRLAAAPSHADAAATLAAAGKGRARHEVQPDARASTATWRWRAAAIGAAVLVLLALGARSWLDGPSPRPPGTALLVDNRAGRGTTTFEDRPLPLTTRPVVNCGLRGCEMKDGPTWESGQRIDRAVCQQRGERITNGDVTMTLYYGVVLRDGATGYVAAIWVARSQRGGLGLPPCSRVLPDLARR